MLTHPTLDQLKALKLDGMADAFVELQNQAQAADLAHAERLPLLATNGVLYAQRKQRAVLDVFTCTRHHTHLDAAGRLLSANDERHLKSAAEMSELFNDLPTPPTVSAGTVEANSAELPVQDSPAQDSPAAEPPAAAVQTDAAIAEAVQVATRARNGHPAARPSCRRAHAA